MHILGSGFVSKVTAHGGFTYISCHDHRFAGNRLQVADVPVSDCVGVGRVFRGHPAVPVRGCEGAHPDAARLGAHAAGGHAQAARRGGHHGVRPFALFLWLPPGFMGLVLTSTCFDRVIAQVLTEKRT